MSTPPDRSAGSIIELPYDECVALLGTTTVGRIAFVDPAGQQLIPINFVLIDGDVFFRTASDGILSGLGPGHTDVAFGVDHHADLYRDGWNVTVQGTVAEVTDPVMIESITNHSRLRPWAGGDRPMVLRVTPRSIDGRRVSGH